VAAPVAAAVPSSEVLEWALRAIRFRREVRGQTVPNAFLSGEQIRSKIMQSMDPFVLEHLQVDPQVSDSMRRKEAVLKLARTIADLRESPEISALDLDEAISLGLRGHKLLGEWRE
jgi:predicted ATPase with chaperone activity